MLLITFPLAGLYFFIPVFGNFGTAFRKQQYQDTECNANSLTDFGIVGNVIACSRVCSSTAGCRGFHFNEVDNRCWGSDQTKCQALPGSVYYYKDCGVPPALPNSEVSPGGTLEGDNRTYSCLPGYVLLNVVATDTTCQHNSTWSAPSFDCVWDCGIPPALPNSEVSSGGTLVGATRTYSCLPGYVLLNVVTMDITCQHNSAWSAPSFDCVWDCGVPNTIPNSLVLPGGTLEGHTRTYSCLGGYIMRNLVNVDTMCQSGGSWSTPSFDCVWDCGTPSSVANATLSVGDTVEGTIRTYTCNAGYAMNGTTTLTCQTGASWSPIAFSCVPDCGAPPAIANAIVTVGGTLEGETRTYACLPGYVLRNGVTFDTTCQHNSSWSMPTSDCLFDCSEPPVIENATVSAGDTLEGTTRNYTCIPGHVVNGTEPMTSTCQSDGTWTAVEAKCQPRVCPPGWYQLSSSCYMVYDSIIELPNSMTFCQTTYPYDTYMLQLETAEEDVAVVTKIMQNDTAMFCLGLHDPLHNGVWKWFATDEPLTYSNWLVGQPDGGQYFVVDWASDNFQWRDLGTFDTCKPICEIR